MFLVWTSDLCPFLNQSDSSRYPIAVIPAARYAISDSGVNLTLDCAAQHIVKSFNKLSTSGIKVRDDSSLYSRRVP